METELMENGNFGLFFLQTEKGNGKLPYVCCKQTPEVGFPWSANDKR
jgi:hypothetical protein